MSTLLSLLFAEGAVRAWGAIGGKPGPENFIAYDADLGWRNVVSFDGRHAAADFDVAVHIDAAGHRRGREPAVAPKGAPLVFAIGDSTTFGWGVEYGETWVALLQRGLHAVVRNMGVTGYGSDQQLLVLRRALKESKPKLVLVMHTANDVMEVLRSYVYRNYKPRFELDGDALMLSGVPVPRDVVAESSHLWRTLLKHFGRFEAEPLSATATAEGRDLVQRIYREMDRECRARGGQLVLVAHSADWLGAFARSAGIRFVDLSATFARSRKAGPIRFANDPHWLPRLHVAVAAELERYVRSEGLLR